MKGPPKGRKRRSTNVPGQFLGYSLQVTRLTDLLIQAKSGSRGSLEVLDDVALVDADGKTTAVQSKSALTGNPLGDNSSALWKTFANWADSLESLQLPSALLDLVIYVSKPASGTIAEKFAAATEAKDVSAVIAFVQEHFAKNPLPADSEVARHVSRFFGHKSEIIQLVVRSFRIECGSGSPQSDLEGSLDHFFFKDGRARQLADMACGWVKRRVDEMIEKSVPAIIDRDEFHHEMQVFYTQFVERAILQSFVNDPSPRDVAEHHTKTYVQQLEIIEADFEEKMSAISSFFKATLDRTNWGASGIVQKGSFDELDNNLHSTWKNHHKLISFRDGHRPHAERGQLLLSECLNHIATVENLQAPSHFIQGCFHVLSDKQVIGWHPDYKAELKKHGKGSGK